MDAKFRKVQPLRSMGNPGKGCLSLAPDAALITFLSNLKKWWLKLLENDSAVEMKDELRIFAQVMPLTSLPKNAATLELGVLRATEMQGLGIAICVLGIAVPAIGFKSKNSTFPTKFDDIKF